MITRVRLAIWLRPVRPVTRILSEIRRVLNRRGARIHLKRPAHQLRRCHQVIKKNLPKLTVQPIKKDGSETPICGDAIQ